MLSYTFRMLPQKSGTSLIFIESCFAFLLKVYINQSRIWDTFLTSKMALFMTIVICKVIFLRLMILYTQYCPMSAFIYVSSLLVPFRSMWFHLQTSERVLLMTITISNFVFYWAMVLHVQFLPMNFLFFKSVLCWVQLLTGSSRWLQLVPGGSSSFLVLVYTREITTHSN